MSEIVWTKEWSAADDGTVVSGADLGNIQSDIGIGVTTNAVAIQGIPVDAPEAGDDESLLFYDHSNLKFDYVDPPAAAIPLTYLDTDDTLAADSDTKVPSQQATKAYVDNNKTELGAWDNTSYSINTNYLAATDGWVSVYTSTSGGQDSNAQIRTNTGSPATVIRAFSTGSGSSGNNYAGTTCFVRKGDYWSCSVDGTPVINWIPLS